LTPLKYFIAFVSLAFLLFSSCESGGTTQNDPKTNVANSKNSSTNTDIEKLPSIPVPLLQTIFEKSNHVDYIFYESSFSMSMDNQGSIQATLRHISQEVPVLDKPCKSIGRVFYEIDGETEIEAEIYFSNECQHFVFLKNNKRMYANNITPDGVAHFQNVFKEAAKMVN